MGPSEVLLQLLPRHQMITTSGIQPLFTSIYQLQQAKSFFSCIGLHAVPLSCAGIIEQRAIYDFPRYDLL